MGVSGSSLQQAQVQSRLGGLPKPVGQPIGQPAAAQAPQATPAPQPAQPSGSPQMGQGARRLARRQRPIGQMPAQGGPAVNGPRMLSPEELGWGTAKYEDGAARTVRALTPAEMLARGSTGGSGWIDDRGNMSIHNGKLTHGAERQIFGGNPLEELQRQRSYGAAMDRLRALNGGLDLDAPQGYDPYLASIFGS
jgi:hypothetical protein